MPPARAADSAAGIEVTAEFERFHQRNDIFTRAFWDDSVRTENSRRFFESYYRMMPRRAEGFSRKDFALRNAAWLISNLITDRRSASGIREGFQAPIACDTPVAAEAAPVEDPSAMSEEIKKVARFFGANLCGITDADERWLYASAVNSLDMSPVPNELPPGLHSVIVLGHEMQEDLVATYPSALGGAATGREYSHEAAIVMQVAAYIRNLGYEAVPSMNDTSLVIPFALKAGLGEYARNQLVVTREYGPRLRFSKIFTNLPLAYDLPRKLGVAAYCDICTKCADACPAKALPYGPPSVGGTNRSAIKGVRKWTSDAEKCFKFWTKLASDCAICMRVCGFNRDFSKLRHRLWLHLALSRFRKIALWLDRGRGARRKPEDWWAS